MNCEKCKSGKSYEWAESVQLIGGFTVRLCNPCRNAFHEYIKGLPLGDEYDELTDRGRDIALAAQGQREPTEALAPIRARLRAIYDEFYEIGKAWVLRPVESGATVDAVDPHVAK